MGKWIITYSVKRTVYIRSEHEVPWRRVGGELVLLKSRKGFAEDVALRQGLAERGKISPAGAGPRGARSFGVAGVKVFVCLSLDPCVQLCGVGFRVLGS